MFAEVFEQVQWAFRPANLSVKPPFFHALEVKQGAITKQELKDAFTKLKDGQAFGPDEIPVEYWKAIMSGGSDGSIEWLLSLSNACLSNYAVPHAWQSIK